MTVDFAEEERVPDESEIRDLLERYFVGPITEAMTKKLHAHIVALLADRDTVGGERHLFDPYVGQLDFGFGYAWREELSFGRRRPRSINLAAFMAASSPGYPEPCMYRSDAVIGRWVSRMIADERITFAGDGTFHTESTSLAHFKSWCVHRHSPDGPKGDEIRLGNYAWRPGNRTLVIEALGPTRLTFRGFSSHGTCRYDLERID